MTMKVLFVGPVSGYASYSVVSKGILRALMAFGIHPVVADVTWDGSQDHTEPFFEQKENGITFLEPSQVTGLVNQSKLPFDGITKCVAVNPGFHLSKVRDAGVKLAGMFVGDVDVIPDSWRQVMEKQDLILTPSVWCKDVIEASGIDRPVTVLNHGVSPSFVPSGRQVEQDTDEPFVFLHMCSSVFYPERKGTPQVLRAFETLVGEGADVVLRLIFGMKSKPVKDMLRTVPKEIRSRIQTFYFSGSRSHEEIQKSYEACHAGLFPSRAEGFGIIPLEFRALGQPVVQTFCTGHRDHLDPDDNPARWGIVEVHHGEMEAAWGKFGRAPHVDFYDVVVAMKDCMSSYSRLKEASVDMSEAVRTQWSWEQTTEPLVEWLNG